MRSKSSRPVTSSTSRRQFIKGAAAVAGATALGAGCGFPAILRGKNLNDKMSIACIATGGRGGVDLREFESENIVALCDVNEQGLAGPARKHPQAKTFKDYRKLYDTLKDSEFDAVVVATPEHHHAFATLPALRRKKHVYCEKPLTRDVHECRLVRQVAAGAGVATQMGTQNHANPNYHRVVELVQSGAIGPVSEVHTWVDRAWGLQTQEEAEKAKDRLWLMEHKWYMDRPKEAMPVPDYLDWDLWVGPAPFRPYHSVYFPGPKWYRWWDFGNGTMSDLGSHSNDLPYWALKLDAPKSVEAFGPPPHPEIAPATMHAVYEYGARGDLPPVKFTWYQGNIKPPQWETNPAIKKYKDGTLFVGTNGRMLVANYKDRTLLPEKEFKDFKPPAQTIAAAPNDSHWQEWLAACKTGSPTGSPFATYAGPLTEANHLGNVAYRAGGKIEWDPINMKIPNRPSAEQFLGREYRKGWEL